jgi:hypothetical protein
VRALQGGRPTYESGTNTDSLLALTTEDVAGNRYLLVTNSAAGTSYVVDADLSALRTTGVGTMWLFDATHPDVIVATPALAVGHLDVRHPRHRGRAAEVLTTTAGSPPHSAIDRGSRGRPLSLT